MEMMIYRKMRKGSIVSFGAKRFGFLLDPETRQEHFFHIANVVGRKSLRTGDSVQFELGYAEDDRKPAPAVWVKLIDSTGGR
jgi:cold shock CspA family protein